MENVGITKSHDIRIVNRESAEFTGICEVVGFDESSIILITGDGELTVEGEGLKISDFSSDSRTLSMTGRIEALSYVDESPKRQKKRSAR